MGGTKKILTHLWPTTTQKRPPVSGRAVRGGGKPRGVVGLPHEGPGQLFWGHTHGQFWARGPPDIFFVVCFFSVLKMASRPGGGWDRGGWPGRGINRPGAFRGLDGGGGGGKKKKTGPQTCSPCGGPKRGRGLCFSFHGNGKKSFDPQNPQKPTNREKNPGGRGGQAAVCGFGVGFPRFGERENGGGGPFPL